MLRKSLLAAVLFAVSAPAVQAADCGVVLDELSKAISGNLNMSSEKKAAMMRMASTSYDYCMAGDTKGAGNIRDMLMSQIRESLGGR